MINLSRDIQSLSTFKRNTNKLIAQMKETGNPIVLTVNGKAELVVQDVVSYIFRISNYLTLKLMSIFPLTDAAAKEIDISLDGSIILDGYHFARFYLDP